MPTDIAAQRKGKTCNPVKIVRPATAIPCKTQTIKPYCDVEKWKKKKIRNCDPAENRAIKGFSFFFFSVSFWIFFLRMFVGLKHAILICVYMDLHRKGGTMGESELSIGHFLLPSLYCQVFSVASLLFILLKPFLINKKLIYIYIHTQSPYVLFLILDSEVFFFF